MNLTIALQTNRTNTLPHYTGRKSESTIKFPALRAANGLPVGWGRVESRAFVLQKTRQGHRPRDNNNGSIAAAAAGNPGEEGGGGTSRGPRRLFDFLFRRNTPTAELRRRPGTANTHHRYLFRVKYIPIVAWRTPALSTLCHGHHNRDRLFRVPCIVSDIPRSLHGHRTSVVLLGLEVELR